MTGDDSGPRRDVKNGDYECSHCGGKASNLLGEEHIWKCSEAVPIAELEALVDEWRERVEKETESKDAKREKRAVLQAAGELQEVIETYE